MSLGDDGDNNDDEDNDANGDGDDDVDSVVVCGMPSVGFLTGCVASLSKTLSVIILVGSVPVSFIVYGNLFATPCTLYRFVSVKDFK